MPIKAIACILLICVVAGAACAGKVSLKDPIRLADDQNLKAVYFFPHWWDPWKSDDAALTADLQKVKGLGFNTICVDHEVSQAIDREWYWLDREYKLAGAEEMYILPWLQLQSVDRNSLAKFANLELKAAIDQNGQVQDDCVVYRDEAFQRALTHYINVYLDRYANDPALLRIKDRGKLRPVVGIMLEAGWRTTGGLPLSFDDDTNAYFRKWMKASHYDLAHLNSKWGTSYQSFDEIDPCDSTIFDYACEDKSNMPVAVQEHCHFRARLLGDALQKVAQGIRKKHKDVLFLVEVAYPLSSDDPNASVYKWNSANEYKSIEFADIIFIRTLGNTSCGPVAKEQNMMMLNGKRLILAYRFFTNATQECSIAFATDCAMSANGLACYNWNETADDTSAIYNSPEKQSLAKLMTSTYDLLYDSDRRHDMIVAPPPPKAPAPADEQPSNANGSSAEKTGEKPETEAPPAEGTASPAPATATPPSAPSAVQ